MRDRHCVVTGQEVPARARGGKFTDYEVAHIVPLMAVNNVSIDFINFITVISLFFYTVLLEKTCP
jgi:hypothetical protein